MLIDLCNANAKCLSYNKSERVGRFDIRTDEDLRLRIESFARIDLYVVLQFAQKPPKYYDTHHMHHTKNLNANFQNVQSSQTKNK